MSKRNFTPFRETLVGKLILDENFLDSIAYNIATETSMAESSMNGDIIQNSPDHKELARMLLMAASNPQVFYVYDTAMRDAAALKVSRLSNGQPDFGIFLQEDWQTLFVAFGPRQVAKFIRHDEQIFYVSLWTTKTMMIGWQWELFHKDIGSLAEDRGVRDDESLKWSVDDVWRMLAYIFFSDREAWYVEPKTGKEKKALGSKPVKYDKLPFKVHRVTQWWNKTLIYGGSHDVRGHWGLRAYGKGRTKRRLSWIRPHVRSNRTIKF